MLTPRLRTAAPSRRAPGPSHLLCVQPDGAAPSRLGPAARSRSASSNAPHGQSGKRSPPRVRFRGPSAETRRVSPSPGGAGRVGVRLKLLDTHAVPLTPPRTRRRTPSPVARTLPRSGCRPPGLGLCLTGRPRLRLRAAAGRRERSPGCPVALQVQALRPSRPRPPSAPGLGLKSPREQPHPGAARLPANPGRPAGRWRPPALLFPPAASLPLPAGWAPPPPLRDRSPACSPAAQRGVARPALGGGEAGRGGWTRRWGAGGAPRGGGREPVARPAEARRGARGRGAGRESRPAGWAVHPTPAEAPATLRDSPDRATLGCPAAGPARSLETPPNLQTHPLTFRGRPGTQMPGSLFSAPCTVMGGSPRSPLCHRIPNAEIIMSNHWRGIRRDPVKGIFSGKGF